MNCQLLFVCYKTRDIYVTFPEATCVTSLSLLVGAPWTKYLGKGFCAGCVLLFAQMKREILSWPDDFRDFRHESHGQDNKNFLKNNISIVHVCQQVSFWLLENDTRHSHSTDLTICVPDLGQPFELKRLGFCIMIGWSVRGGAELPLVWMTSSRHSFQNVGHVRKREIYTICMLQKLIRKRFGIRANHGENINVDPLEQCWSFT